MIKTTAFFLLVSQLFARLKASHVKAAWQGRNSASFNMVQIIPHLLKGSYRFKQSIICLKLSTLRIATNSGAEKSNKMDLILCTMHFSIVTVKN